ncbi:MAG: MDR family MFS transporter [Dehalococcoidales bacterium]|nr:MDR family MFS transporter [Dehalococcoidales bacterium]
MSPEFKPEPGVDPSSLPRRQILLTLAGVLMALFLSSLNQTVVATAMPRIITDLGGFSQYAWVTTAYLITSTVIVPITGKLSDMYGRKVFYVGAIIIFTLGALLCGFSQTMTQIIIFRAIQGLGAGVMMANALTVVADLFPPVERGKYSGFLSGVIGISSVIGPTLGGVITDLLSWPWVFFMNVPLGMITLFVMLRFFPNYIPDSYKRKVDYAGVAALTLSVVPLMLALSWGGLAFPWTSAPIIGTLVFSAVMLVLFIFIEKRTEDPILPFSLFKNEIVTASIIISFIAGAGTFSVITFVPLFFQGVMGATATASGSFMTPMLLGIVVGSLISGQSLSRIGGYYKLLGGIGIALAAIGLVLLALMTSQTSYSAAIFNITLVGIGSGIIMPCYTLSVQNAVPNKILGVATSASIFFRSIGSVLGLAVFGSIMANRFSAEFIGKLSDSAKAVIPPEMLSSLVDNPQALVNAEAQAGLKNYLASSGEQGTAIFGEVLNVLREALNSALAEVFWISCGMVAVAFVVNLFLKDKPLRRKHLPRE